MDNFKDNLKKAGYAFVGAGALLYEKGKKAYSKLSSNISSNFKNKYDTFVDKGKKVLDKEKED